VLFLIDTLRADRVGAYGHSRATTPNIDALAAEGVVFESAYAPAPWTLPSVVSLMTSTFPCEHGVVVDGLQPSAALEPLAERLSAAGYATASFYANEYAGPGSGLTRGFASATYVDAADGETVGPFLDAVASRPFFLYVHNAEPHDPYTADRETVRRFAPVGARQRDEANQTLVRYRRLTGADFEAGRPPGATDNSAEQRKALAALRRLAPALSGLYDGDVALADQHFGSVRRALEQRGLWDAALVVLLSDHGEEFGEHGGFQHDQSVYEELVRVPLIVRFPGGRHAGGRVGVPVSLVDVVPTLAEVLGRPGLARGSRGRSLLPLARGQEVAPDGARATALRDNRKKYFRPFARLRGDLNVVVREGGWKGIWNAERKRLELYDLTSDARERRDVSALQPERAARLQGVAEEWLRHCRQQGARAPAAPGPALDAEGRARLRALGYVE
jgi:arylsulfatase A-like enzyme